MPKTGFGDDAGEKQGGPDSTPRQSAAPTGCPPDTPDWRPTDGHGCLSDASAQEAEGRSTPTAHHSTTRIASCPCRKFIKTPASGRSLYLEAEPIYETRSGRCITMELAAVHAAAGRAISGPPRRTAPETSLPTAHTRTMRRMDGIRSATPIVPGLVFGETMQSQREVANAAVTH